MEAGEPPDDGDERFLGSVLPVGIVAREAPADGVDLIVVASQQLLECTPVPGLCGPGESGVVEVVANRGIPGCSVVRLDDRAYPCGVAAGAW